VAQVVISMGTSAANRLARVAGADRLRTAIAASNDAFPTAGSAGAVVLARADQFADALAGVPLAAKLHAPLLLTEPDVLSPRTLAEIQRVLAPGGTVVLLGGTSALSAAVAQEIATAGYHEIRYAGTDRFATAVAIASEGLGNPTVDFEANGDDYADAVSAGPAAAAAGGAVLLTNGPTQAGETAQYLSQHPTDTRVAVGGPAAAADSGAQSAIVGQDRYQTSELLAAKYFSAPMIVGLATGGGFADALSGGADVAEAGGPILLTDPTALPSPVVSYLAANAGTITRVVVFGGTQAIGDGVADQAVG
jgi:putative cell wall-binding protein